MQQESHQVAPDGLAYHSLQDIQTEEGASKDHLSEMRINNEDRSDPHNETAGRPGGLPYMIGKGGVVM
jgi:hypothetical protein